MICAKTILFNPGIFNSKKQYLSSIVMVLKKYATGKFTIEKGTDSLENNN